MHNHSAIHSAQDSTRWHIPVVKVCLPLRLDVVDDRWALHQEELVLAQLQPATATQRVVELEAGAEAGVLVVNVALGACNDSRVIKSSLYDV